jgi:hypothetical protein
MRLKKGSLPATLLDLKQTLSGKDTGDPGTWFAHVAQALSGLDQAIRREDASLETPQGQLLDIDQGQIPSPGLDRQVGQLHDDLAGLVDEVRNLRGLLDQTRQNAAEQDDGNAIRQRLDTVVQALERYQQEEDRLVLETSTTDIGTGD